MENPCNETDPITLEDLSGRPALEVFRLQTESGAIQCFDLEALVEWVKINPVNPLTNLAFTAEQLIRMVDQMNALHRQRRMRRKRAAGAPDTIQVFIEGFNGEKTTLVLFPEDTVEDIRDMIEDRLVIPIMHYRLVSSRGELRSGETVQSIGLQDLNQVHVMGMMGSVNRFSKMLTRVSSEDIYTIVSLLGDRLDLTSRAYRKLLQKKLREARQILLRKSANAQRPIMLRLLGIMFAMNEQQRNDPLVSYWTGALLLNDFTPEQRSQAFNVDVDNLLREQIEAAKLVTSAKDRMYYWTSLIAWDQDEYSESNEENDNNSEPMVLGVHMTCMGPGCTNVAKYWLAKTGEHVYCSAKCAKTYSI